VVAIVVPFRGADAKRRLAPMGEEARAELALAMLGDVLAACIAAGEVTVVTADEAGAELAEELGAAVMADPRGGQGAAVALALSTLPVGAALVVNADLPCATPRDLHALVRVTPASGIALVEAADGTTNALGLPAPEAFAPLYGAGSAERFRAHARSLGLEPVTVASPNLARDVDTLADLERVQLTAGPRTQAALAALAR